MNRWQQLLIHTAGGGSALKQIPPVIFLMNGRTKQTNYRSKNPLSFVSLGLFLTYVISSACMWGYRFTTEKFCSYKIGVKDRLMWKMLLIESTFIYSKNLRLVIYCQDYIIKSLPEFGFLISFAALNFSTDVFKHVINSNTHKVMTYMSKCRSCLPKLSLMETKWWV